MGQTTDKSPRLSARWNDAPVLYYPRRQGETGAPEPVPPVLTDDDVIRLARIDESDTEHPDRTLAYYRKEGILRGTQIGRAVRYLLPDVLDFMERAKELNPR